MWNDSQEKVKSLDHFRNFGRYVPSSDNVIHLCIKILLLEWEVFFTRLK